MSISHWIYTKLKWAILLSWIFLAGFFVIFGLQIL